MVPLPVGAKAFGIPHNAAPQVLIDESVVGPAAHTKLFVGFGGVMDVEVNHVLLVAGAGLEPATHRL